MGCTEGIIEISILFLEIFSAINGDRTNHMIFGCLKIGAAQKLLHDGHLKKENNELHAFLWCTLFWDKTSRITLMVAHSWDLMDCRLTSPAPSDGPLVPLFPPVLTPPSNRLTSWSPTSSDVPWRVAGSI